MKDLPPQVTRIAAFDFGSNATKCAIVENKNGKVNYLAEYRVQTRLGASMDADGNISETAMRATVEAAAEMMQHCREMNVEKYLAVGTEALRKAANSGKLIEQLKQRTGLDLCVISAEEEAALTWRGMLATLENPRAEILLFDSGGASTELIYGREAVITHIHSFPLGAVTLTREYMSGEAFSETDYQLMLTYINSIINVATWKGKLLMGSGGGVVACAKVAIAGNASLQTELHNYYLDSAELMRQIELYRRCTAEERRQIPGMEADRADIILASAMIALAIVSAAEAPGLYVCTSGIRQGLIALEVRR